MTQLVDLELAADGVESNGYAMLSLIGVRGPVRLTAIAAELGMPLTTASDVMRRLEARGHVRRSANPEDGRSFLFELTAKGDREWRRGWGAPMDARSLADQMVPQYPWWWSAAVLAGLVGLSTWTLSFRVKSLDRLK